MNRDKGEMLKTLEAKKSEIEAQLNGLEKQRKEVVENVEKCLKETESIKEIVNNPKIKWLDVINVAGECNILNGFTGMMRDVVLRLCELIGLRSGHANGVRTVCLSLFFFFLI
jgi:hypothetical protein